MNLLSMDTSTPRAALAIMTASGLVSTAAPGASARHGRVLVPAIQELLAQAGISVRDLDGIVVGLGPGSYTGLRIGLTAAKTLAFAVSKPLVGFDSLELVARNAPDDARHVAVIADAQRGDVYAASFTRDAPGSTLEPVSTTRVIALAEWSASLPDGSFVLGPAFAVERLTTALILPASVRRPRDADSDWPDPRRLVALAHDAWRLGRRDDPWYLEPVYLRRSAAEDQWDRRVGI